MLSALHFCALTAVSCIADCSVSLVPSDSASCDRKLDACYQTKAGKPTEQEHLFPMYSIDLKNDFL